MKRFLRDFATVLIIVAGAVGLVALLWFTSSGFRNMCIDIGGGNGITGIILFPFALIGGIDIFRGFFLVIEKDGDRFNGDKNFGKLYAYIIVRFLGYIGLIVAVANL